MLQPNHVLYDCNCGREPQEAHMHAQRCPRYRPAPDPEFCMGCGCTAAIACRDRCYWLIPGLCSRCAGACREHFATRACFHKPEHIYTLERENPHESPARFRITTADSTGRRLGAVVQGRLTATMAAFTWVGLKGFERP